MCPTVDGMSSQSNQKVFYYHHFFVVQKITVYLTSDGILEPVKYRTQILKYRL